MLTPSQRAHLRALAHDKKPVVLVGHKGVEAVFDETRAALLAHELIKVRLMDEDLDGSAETLAGNVDAELVARVGRMAILYKRHPETPRIALPGLPDRVAEPRRPRRAAKAPRSTVPGRGGAGHERKQRSAKAPRARTGRR